MKGVTDRTANAVMDTAASVSDRVAGSAMSARQTAVDSMVSVKDRVQSGLDSGKAELDARRQQAGELADELTDQAQTVAQQARQSFARLIEEQPILMAALGAALGAAVGAALPLSQAEKDLIGETGAKAIGIGRGPSPTPPMSCARKPLRPTSAPRWASSPTRSCRPSPRTSSSRPERRAPAVAAVGRAVILVTLTSRAG